MTLGVTQTGPALLRRERADSVERHAVIDGSEGEVDAGRLEAQGVRRRDGGEEGAAEVVPALVVDDLPAPGSAAGSGS